MVTFHVINMHSSNNTFPILLKMPWLKMVDAIVDWRGAEPSITYGSKNNWVKIFIGSLGGWVRKEITSCLKDEGDDKNDDKNDKALVRMVHSADHGRIIDSGFGFLGPSFYHYGDNENYAQWLGKYLESEFDVKVTFHHACLNDEILSLMSEEYFLLKLCEVFTGEEWILRGIDTLDR